MNKKLKKKWVKALRSGDYDQASGALCKVQKDKKGTHLSYCCLGVLADVSGEGEWVKQSPTDSYTDYDGPIRRYKFPTLRDYHEHAEADFSTKQAEILGLAYAEQSTLVDMNDDQGASFKKIAKWIEKNVETD